MPTFYRLADLKAAGLSYSPKHMKELEDAGQFPKRIQLSPKKPVWLKSDVDRFIADRIAASKAGA